VRIQPVGKPKKLSPAEAIYGFAGWLTTRDKPVIFSSRHDAAIVAQLLDWFCKNNLDQPRNCWENPPGELNHRDN
jgi:hypothetical protein